MAFVSRSVFLLLVFVVLGLQQSAAQEINSKKLLAEPNTYIGSDTCRTCHLEHYDAWKRTLHSKMLQDVSKNQDVFVTELDQEVRLRTFNTPSAASGNSVIW